MALKAFSVIILVAFANGGPLDPEGAYHLNDHPVYSYGERDSERYQGDRKGDAVQVSHSFIEIDGTRRVVDHLSDARNDHDAVPQKVVVPFAHSAVAYHEAPNPSTSAPAPGFYAAPVGLHQVFLNVQETGALNYPASLQQVQSVSHVGGNSPSARVDDSTYFASSSGHYGTSVPTPSTFSIHKSIPVANREPVPFGYVPLVAKITAPAGYQIHG